MPIVKAGSNCTLYTDSTHVYVGNTDWADVCVGYTDWADVCVGYTDWADVYRRLLGNGGAHADICLHGMLHTYIHTYIHAYMIIEIAALPVCYIHTYIQ